MSTSYCVTVARNWASSSGKLAVYSSLTMHMYSGALRDRARDRENEIQGFLAHQKDCAERRAAMNPRRRSQRNAGRV